MNQVLITDTPPSRFVRIGDKDYLWFSGTDYLGMAYDAAYLKIISDGLPVLGTHFGSSRNNTLQISAYSRAEQSLATFAGAEDALLVSSGMLAGHLIRTSLPDILAALNPGFQISQIEAPGLHPALRRGTPVNSAWETWAEATARSIRSAAADVFYILYSDAIGSPKPVSFPFGRFAGLDNMLLVVDDSHAIGVAGHSGSGSLGKLTESGILNILAVSSLNKALGIPGGAILGSRLLLDGFRKTATYSGASPFPPVFAHALACMAGDGLYAGIHEKLMQNTRRFFQKLDCKERFDYLPDYPVLTTTDAGLAGSLMEKGILCSSFPYPAADDLPLTRLVITSVHTDEDIDRLAGACNRYYAS
ncbi:8-amino-7-oxononanoate synthase [Ravibacter arvi]|uniref:8-amino-7-oxononanoate synthase n=1 Tax=Ravibacter arvi TaxID=2051041 RepID=A0ABP8MAH8_9BACT